MEFVGVLVFIHEDELEAALVQFANVEVVLQELEPEREEIVKVHCIGGAFAGAITVSEIADLAGQQVEMLVLFGQNLGDGLMRVNGQGEDFAEDFGFGEVAGFGVNTRFGDARRDQMFGVFAVEDGEVAFIAEFIGVGAQDAVADGVEGAAPQFAQLLAEQIGDAPHHFAGGFVGEGEQQDAVGGNALFEQVGDAIDEGARLAGAGAGNDERRAGRRGNGGVLLLVEFTRVINLQINRRAEGLEDVVAGHGKVFSIQYSVFSKRETSRARQLNIEAGGTLKRGHHAPFGVHALACPPNTKANLPLATGNLRRDYCAA